MTKKKRKAKQHEQKARISSNYFLLINEVLVIYTVSEQYHTRET